MEPQAHDDLTHLRLAKDGNFDIGVRCSEVVELPDCLGWQATDVIMDKLPTAHPAAPVCDGAREVFIDLVE